MNSSHKNLVLFLLSVLFLIACQPNWKVSSIPVNNGVDQKTEITSQSEIVMLLGYFRFLDSLSADALALERERTRKTLAKFHDPIHRLRLAMLLSLPLSDSQDYERALELLAENLDRSIPIDPVLRDFSLFLSASVRQFKKQDGRYQDLENKMLAELGTTQKQGGALTRKLEHLEGRYKSLSQELKDERARRKKLQKMIDGLKIIEKNIIIRDNN